MGIGHADAAMHLYHFIGNQMHKIPGARLSQGAQRWYIGTVAVTCAQGGFDTGTSQFQLSVHPRGAVLGEEAVKLGLATRVCADPRAEALAFASLIANQNPDAIRAGKRLLNLATEADAKEILRAETTEQVALIGSPNQVEAVMANLQKRAPRFVDG